VDDEVLADVAGAGFDSFFDSFLLDPFGAGSFFPESAVVSPPLELLSEDFDSAGFALESVR
jgi:hypothetical protein